MLLLKGKEMTAKVFQDHLDEVTKGQILTLLDQPFFKDSQIRIMPDCHAGKGCVIGTTMTLKDKVVPNLVGVDIGCGMLLVELGKKAIHYKDLDEFITSEIPSGMDIHEAVQPCPFSLQELRCIKELNKPVRFLQALGTLGGGNHFIEIDADEEGNHYLIIHSGSRNLGKQVADYYQKRAVEEQGKKVFDKDKAVQETIHLYKKQHRERELQSALKAISEKSVALPFPEDLAYLEGSSFEDYLHDMDLCQRFAVLNRERMAEKILSFLGLSLKDCPHRCTIHNYIDMEDRILRKGAVRARKGERLIIPINMRDGTILAVGKGNPDYNYSAPHGAGRLYSRSEAKKKFTLEEYALAMKGIYTTSVKEETLDESPFAYKSLDMILPYLKETVEVEKIIKPVYNFKASDERLPYWVKGVRGA
jgi:tRNA-splicing ligase RtcB